MIYLLNIFYAAIICIIVLNYENLLDKYREKMRKEHQNKLLPLLTKVAEKTIGFNISGTKAMTDEESYEWHKKHSRIDPKTGNLIISDDEIGDGTYEKLYEKLIK